MAANGAPFLETDDICLYFTFPALGFSIALCPGDILILDPQQHHSVSSRCDLSQPIWCTSLYLENSVVGGNNNHHEFDEMEKQSMEMLQSITDRGNGEIHPFTPNHALMG